MLFTPCMLSARLRHKSGATGAELDSLAGSSSLAEPLSHADEARRWGEGKSRVTPWGNMKAARSVNHRGLPGGGG